PQVTQAAMQFDGLTSNHDLPITVDEAMNYFKECYFYPDTNRHQPNLQTTNSAIVSVSDLQHEVKLLNKERRTVLDIEDITFYEGEQIDIVGNNGAGKTTLMKSLAGIIKQKQGTVHVDGMDVVKTPDEQLLRHITILYEYSKVLFII